MKQWPMLLVSTTSATGSLRMLTARLAVADKEATAFLSANAPRVAPFPSKVANAGRNASLPVPAARPTEPALPSYA